jgi:hypothetical protein
MSSQSKSICRNYPKILLQVRILLNKKVNNLTTQKIKKKKIKFLVYYKYYFLKIRPDKQS